LVYCKERDASPATLVVMRLSYACRWRARLTLKVFAASNRDVVRSRQVKEWVDGGLCVCLGSVVMLTLQDSSSLRVSSKFKPTIGVSMRAAFDIGSIWVAFLTSWIIVDRKDVNVLFTHEAFPTLLFFVGLISIVAFIFYTDAGIYSAERRRDLLAKSIRLIWINVVLLAIAGAAVSLTKPAAASARGLLATFTVASALHLLARLSSAVLRSEDESQRDRGQHDEPDPNKVLVIGGAGYIGSALVEKLLRLGMHVSILDAMHYGEEPLASVAGHPNLTLIREDFRHIEILTRAISGMGSVIHLAGLVGDPACAVDADLTVDINVTGTKLVGEIAKARGVRRFIFASSCSVYGACDEIVDEQSRLNPQSLYARSKVASEAVLVALNSPEFAVTCLRFATVYGISGRTRFDLVVNLLCAKAVRDKLITVFGPDQWRPFVHVDDVAAAIATTLQAPLAAIAGEAFNVGSDDQNFTLGEAAELIKKQIPEAEIASDSDFVDKRNYRVSFGKIRERLGFEPAWTLEHGIAQVTGLVRTNQVGHYSQPTYSNLLYLKERGVKSFANFKITGWESELMNIDRISTANGDAGRTAAA
jgi:nucleoside-diphosphate-sugar epimerase